MAKRVPDCCGNCRFLRNQQCHKAHPQVVVSSIDDGGHLTKWPEVDENEWCGEHQRVHVAVKPYGDDFR